MTRWLFGCLIALCLLEPAMLMPVRADEITDQSLQRVAVDLARQYDANYAAANADGMAHVYAADGILVSPSGKIVRGRANLKTYYVARFAAGAKNHAITVTEVHVQGDGGYGLCKFAVTVRNHDGTERREEGNLVAVYKHAADGWHLALVIPSALPGK
jgi:uncharacterized protein (TIGR02246 family)